ncbi:hypothetical protein [Amycolatopsis sp. BJA-103]|nr:hypothetical protein [Amycolatopsis sp. BJA-103]
MQTALPSDTSQVGLAAGLLAVAAIIRAILGSTPDDGEDTRP